MHGVLCVRSGSASRDDPDLAADGVASSDGAVAVAVAVATVSAAMAATGVPAVDWWARVMGSSYEGEVEHVRSGR
jgi:hypothetical protein